MVAIAMCAPFTKRRVSLKGPPTALKGVSMVRSIMAISSLLLTFSAGACDSPSAPASIAGTYNLVSYDDEPLPYRVSSSDDGTVHIEVRAAVLTLATSGDFSLVGNHIRRWPGVEQETSDTINGEYSFDGKVVVLSLPDTEALSLVRRGDELTATIEGHVLVYRRLP